VVSPLAFASGRASETAAGASAAAGALEPSQALVVVMPSAAGIRPADLRSLAARLDAAVSTLASSDSSVSTAMPQVLTDAAEGLAAARSLVLISGMQLLLLAAAALALAGRLLASQREEETALLAARGAARWQLIRPSPSESAFACAVAAAVGAVAGVHLSGLLLGSLIGYHPPGPAVGVGTWLAAAVLLVFCLGIAIWPALRPRGTSAVRIRRGREAATATVALAGLDIALVALAAVAVYELLTYSAAGEGAHVSPVIERRRLTPLRWHESWPVTSPPRFPANLSGIVCDSGRRLAAVQSPSVVS
jgi:predicted lysophospholipase L1 biosynthesis ABC-type transport system permease subunit